MSQPPQYPGNPADPQGGNPPGYPPPPRHGGPPPPPPGGGYGSPGGGYGAPGGGYGGPPPSFSPPPSGPDFSKPQSSPSGGPGGYQAPGYSAPPPPPPGGGYGAPGASPAGLGGGPTAPYSVGDAFKWAWGKFTKNAAAIAVASGIFVIGIGIVFGILYASFLATMLAGGKTSYDPETGTRYWQASDASDGVGSFLFMVVLLILLAVVSLYMQTSLLSGSLDVADGRPVTIASFLKPRNFGPAVLTGLLVAVGVSIGSVLCYIPGLIFAFLTMFAVPFAIDQKMSPVDAVKASIATTRANVGPTLLTWLVQVAVMLVGEFACGIGLVVAVPVAMLIQVYAYRTLTGGQVAPLEQAGLPSGPPSGQQYPAQQQYPNQQQYPGQQY